MWFFFFFLKKVFSVECFCCCCWMCVSKFNFWHEQLQWLHVFTAASWWSVCTEGSPLQLVLCFVLCVLGSLQFIVCLKELLPQFFDLTLRLLGGALLLCFLQLSVHSLQLSTTPFCLFQTLELTVLTTVKQTVISKWGYSKTNATYRVTFTLAPGL